MKNNKGFSLVELIVVIAIMAILAAIAIPTFAHFIEKANESNDKELLGNINYIFSAACLENGVDVKDVTGAQITISDSGIVLTTVKVNNKENTDIVTSFTQHFADMKMSKFKSKEYKDVTTLTFNTSKKAFEPGVDVYGSIEFDPDDIQAIKDSIFGDLGSEVLLGRIDLATGLLSQIAGEKDSALSDKVGLMITNDVNKEALAKYLGYENAEDPDFLDEFEELTRTKMDMMKQDYPDMGDLELKALAQTEILSNNAVLVAATQSGFNQAEFATKMANGQAKNEILDNLAGNDTQVSTALSQAAMVYGMYTSYAAHRGIEVGDEFDMQTVLDAMDDSDFQDYMANDADNDVKAYGAAMGMINTSSQNEDAVRDVLLNGFDNQNLNDAMGDAFN